MCLGDLNFLKPFIDAMLADDSHANALAAEAIDTMISNKTSVTTKVSDGYHFSSQRILTLFDQLDYVVV